MLNGCRFQSDKDVKHDGSVVAPAATLGVHWRGDPVAGVTGMCDSHMVFLEFTCVSCVHTSMIKIYIFK
jgi:hypothetical protein